MREKLMETIDERVITDEFLLEYFPSPNRFQEAMQHPDFYPQVTINASKEIYTAFREKLNQERAKEEKSPWSDSDIKHLIETARGKLSMPKPSF